MANDHQDDMNDPNNPLNTMFPSKESNPEYDRLKSEHEENIQGAAEQGVMSDPAFASMGDRMQRVRKNVPQAAAPQPAPKTDIPPLAPPQTAVTGTGLQVDPEQGRPTYTPVEPSLPAGALSEAPAASQTTSVAKRVRPAFDTGVNPVLAKLRQDFGIDSIPIEDVKLGDCVFSLRTLDTGSVGMAMRFSETLSLSQGESALNLQLACVAFSVQAIDGIPLWKVMGIEIEENQKVTVEGRETHQFPPLTPPPGMRIQGATSFMDFLGSEAAPSLSEELWKAYGKQVDHKGSLAGIVERLKAGEEEAENIPLP